jgi:hypothetical protein
MTNHMLIPVVLMVKTGARIAVSNRDSTAHTASSDDATSLDTGSLDPGSSIAITLITTDRVTY